MRDNKERVIMHNTQKKQNRILLAALVVILASAAILVAITGSANRKNPPENPPLDNHVEDEGTEDTNSPSPMVTPEKITPDDGEKESATLPNADRDDKKTDAPIKPADEDKEVSSILDKTLPEFSAPVDSVVIKDYSDNVPVFSYTMNDYRIHNGLDFAASPGTPVYAAADGVICEIVDDPMMGATIAIQHSGGAITRYKGLSEDSLDMHNIGDELRRGDVIGAAGDTALIESAEEAHLHFEMTIEGEHVDPAEYMQVSHLSELYEG